MNQLYTFLLNNSVALIGILFFLFVVGNFLIDKYFGNQRFEGDELFERYLYIERIKKLRRKNV
jgi:hypothetical protein